MPLPFVDEHAVVVEAGPDDVWAALTSTLDAAFSSTAATTYARMVGCADDRGFHVASEVPGKELELIGGHRYSSYALSFHIDEIGHDRSRLRAETRASFPGVHGAVYRMLVIGSRGHVVAVRELLARIRRAAESRASAVDGQLPAGAPPRWRWSMSWTRVF
jgi:hypothetical protein